MDPDTLVDNATSIALHIDIAKKKGDINLSSIYGSYNYICNVNCPADDIAVFSCPSCGKDLNTKSECKVCKAPMASLILDMGGKISYCTRSGCKNHSVEFEDLNNALRKMYQEYGYQKQSDSEALEIVHPEEEKDEDKEILETGTFLQAYCPHCRKSLIESDMLKLKLVNEQKEEGFVLLSPYLNVFSSKSTIFLAEGKPVDDLRCFHCDHTLMVDDRKCEVCDSPVGAISISARSKLIDFFLCSKKGCRWHGLSEDDINDIKLDDSLEW
jgi:ssDNA-binding Zn-finger/Zn-ribbon topoisomerase 1